METMENSELLNFILECNANLDPNIPLLYEASFFKIYVKFENYLALIFERYCIGTTSSKGYLPERKLNFIDEEHLRAVLKSGNKRYVDYINTIQSLSKHIFIDNPFNVIFDEQENNTVFNQMIVLRNYIAHESGESKTKFINCCLGNGALITPSEFLMKINRRNSLSQYTIYIKKIEDISTLILERPLV